MLSENLKFLRKQKGMSQEELAARLNVVRQTVSKWEKGLSVPDAHLLMKLAEILGVSVAELLGGKICDSGNENEIAGQLAQINEQLVIKNRRTRLIWKIFAGIAAAFLVFNLSLAIIALIAGHAYTTHTNVEQIPVSEETLIYEIK